MAVKKQVKLAIIGLGTVGSGVVEVINRNRQSFVAKTGSDILIKKALVRDITRPRRVDLTGIELTDKPEDVLEDPDIDVVVELMGGVDKAGLYIAEALRRGKYVVTANKDLLAQKGAELMRLAREMGKGIYYEASVGGGIPLIRPLKHCLAANKIKKILGIINGTTNYILTRMTYEQMEFSEALAEAQAKGFAEQDPSSDIEGKDAAFKLAILAADAFHSEVDINKVYREGIADVKLRDILYAEELGFIVKLLAIGEESEAGISLKVHPTLIPKTHPLAGVLDEFNAVLLEGDAVGEVMFYGRGAGSLPTASAVVADVIDVVRRINYQVQNGLLETKAGPKKIILPVEELYSRFYLRLTTVDEPGVFAGLAIAFAAEKVSLDMIIQKSSEAKTAEIVLVTHNVQEKSFARSLEKIKELKAVKSVNSLIRVAGKQ